MIANYTNDDDAREARCVTVDLGTEKEGAIVSIVDKRKWGRGKTYEVKDGKVTLSLAPNSFAYISL